MTIAWVFFRAESLENAVAYLYRALALYPEVSGFRLSLTPTILITALVLLEAWFVHQKDKLITIVLESIGLLLVLGNFLASISTDDRGFIYFQF